MSTGRQMPALVVAIGVACMMVYAEAANLKSDSYSGYAVDTGCTRQYEVDYLDLAITWGPGFCSTAKGNCKPNVESKFTIHGLWPQRRSHSTPINCCTKTFYDGSEVKAIRPELRSNWPALSNHGDDTFWPYEWNKHGSCAVRIKGVSSVREYFDFTLKTFKKWNFEQILTKNGIYPNSQHFINGETIIAALSKAVGARVSIDCNPTKKNPTVLALTQVHVCFDKNLKLIDCKNTSKKCRDKIKFPRLIEN